MTVSCMKLSSGKLISMEVIAIYIDSKPYIYYGFDYTKSKRGP